MTFVNKVTIDRYFFRYFYILEIWEIYTKRIIINAHSYRYPLFILNISNFLNVSSFNLLFLEFSIIPAVLNNLSYDALLGIVVLFFFSSNMKKLLVLSLYNTFSVLRLCSPSSRLTASMLQWVRSVIGHWKCRHH